MTNLAFVVSMLITNTPMTNFVPSGQMKVTYEVQWKHEVHFTNENRESVFTFTEAHSDFSLYFQKQVDWIPAKTVSPAFIPVPPLPANR